MAYLETITKIERFECTCPKCYTRIRSDDIESPIYGISYGEVSEIYHGDEWEIECPECGHKFIIDEVDWE